MSRLMADQGIFTVGGWGDFLYGGYFGVHNLDPWFLSHMLMMPLSSLDFVTAQHLFVVLLTMIFTMTFVGILRSWHLQPRLVSILTLMLLLGHIQFSFRLMLGRPLFLMMSVMMLIVALILKRQFLVVFALMIVATLLSHLFVFPLVAVITFAAWLWIRGERQSSLSLVGLSLAAVCAGILIHPHSLQYVHYLSVVFFRLPFLDTVEVGSEMLTGIGRMGMVVALLGCISLMIALLRQKNVSWKSMNASATTPLLFLCVVFTLGMILWVRMIDVLWPLLLLTLARLSTVSSISWNDLERFLPAFALRTPFSLAILVLLVSLHTIKLHYTLLTSDAHRDLAPFAESLGHLEAGSRILNVDWYLFPALYSTRPDLVYARGMDPGFDAVMSSEVSGLYAQIRRGEMEWEDALEELRIFYPSTDALVLWKERHPRFADEISADTQQRLFDNAGSLFVLHF